MAEGRLSRWSRLKQRGGADEREEVDIEKTREIEKQAVAEAEPETFNLPGGVRVRHFVPAMAPLAPEPEEDDDRLTRGIGHAEKRDDGGEPDMQALQNGPVEPTSDQNSIEDNENFDAEADDAGFTEQEKEVVSTLPPLESLNGESDFTPFMRDGVPEIIKRRAMRILWKSNPLFGFRDGLNDYDEDFNIVHKIINETVGAYQVGRGHLSEEELQNMMPEEAKRAFDEDENEEELTEEAKLSEEGENEQIEAEEVSAESETDSDQNLAGPSDVSAEVDHEDDADIDDAGDLTR